MDLPVGIFLGFFTLIGLAALLVPRDYIYRGAPDRRLWRDLRWWAAGLVAVHIAVYWYFS